MNPSARGGMRLGDFWGTWPSARIEFTPAEIRIDFFGRHRVAREDVEQVSFVRGAFTCEIHIHHTCSWSDDPIRFFGFGSLRHLERFAIEAGYPCDSRKKRFYEKGDIEIGAEAHVARAFTSTDPRQARSPGSGRRMPPF